MTASNIASLKPLAQLTAADIASIATGGVPEDAQTEFKEGVPDKRDGPSDHGRWATRGELSERARNNLLAEVIAFANSYGGTLYIGIEETDTDPSRSLRLKPVPQVARLATVLEDSMRDCVEPRLLAVEVACIILDEASRSGVLVIRTAPSPLAPHWNRAARQAYRRIGASTQAISMLDIQAITLERARTGVEVERVFQERRAAFEALWDTYSAECQEELNLKNWRSDREQKPEGYALRCTAVPILPSRTINVTARADLKIGIGPVLLRTRPGDANAKRQLSFVGSTETPLFQPALRAWSYKHGAHGGYHWRHHQLVRGDGVLESLLLQLSPDDRQPQLPIEFLFANAFGLLFALETFRVRTGTTAIPYELELEVRLQGEVDVLSFFGDPQPGTLRFPDAVTILPRYLAEGRGQFDRLVEAIQHDVWNAMGRELDEQHIRRVEVDYELMEQVIASAGSR
jgi:hypothetical protein